MDLAVDEVVSWVERRIGIGDLNYNGVFPLPRT